VKPLKKCQPYLWRELDGTPSIVVIDTESGSYYRASEADARIAELEAEAKSSRTIALQAVAEVQAERIRARELEAEREAARAEIKALQFRVDQQRILAGFGDTDLRLAREQREAAYRVLRRIARYTMSQFASAIDMADACVEEAREMFPEEGGDEQGST